MVFTNLPKFSKLLKFPPFSFHLALIIPITPINNNREIYRISLGCIILNFELKSHMIEEILGFVKKGEPKFTWRK